ncbi:HD domain-containing protein [archaeon]|nr:HD domain-containing protein [archaeon]
MIIKLAKKFAKEKHKGQVRKFSNKPYVKHPEKVASIIKKNKKSHKLNEIISAAILHDTLEDTNTSEKELKKNFGNLITSLVKELTTKEDEKNKIGKKEYLAKKMTSMSSWALVIKLADRLDNVSDLKNSSKEFRERYIDETNFILNEIEKNRPLSETHKKLIKKIKNKLK